MSTPPVSHHTRRQFASWLIAPALALPSLATAADAAPGVSAGTALQTFLGLVFILALFLAAAWLARRMGAGRIIQGNGPLKIVGGLSISPRERILLVEVEDTWLVIGVGPGQMRTLHTLPKGSIPPPGGDDGKFGHWLQQFRSKQHNAQT